MAIFNAHLLNAKIGAKFNSLLVLSFFVGILLSSLMLSSVLQQRAEYEISVKADLLMQTMNSLRYYTQDRVNPLLKPQLETASTFIPEAIPTYSVREVSEYLRKNDKYHDFFYKDAALNPTNPRDQADSFETALVERFRQQPELKELSGFRSTPEGKKFYTAHPFKIEEKRCLECHSRPDIAPKSLLVTYGEHGFGWQLNQVIAAQMVYVPSEKVFDETWRAFFSVMLVIMTIFFAVILLINFLLKKVVIQRIKNIAKTANAVSTGEINANFEENSKDEIGLLAIAFERMRSSLLIAMDLLKQQKT